MDEIIKRDQNFVTVLAGVTNDSDKDITMLRVDPITKRLLISATGGGSGVTSLNTLTGAITLAAGSNITLTPVGNTITIASSGGGGGTPGGLNTQIQYNNVGSFGGISGATTDGTIVSLNGAHLLNPTINGAGTGLATLVYPNTSSSATITFPTTTGTLALTSQLTSGTVTSVSGSGGTTGLTLTGGPITTSGTLTLGGTLSIANGGTGQTTANTAFSALVPSQTGNSGKFLTTNGTNTSWGTPTGGSPGGSNQQVQYNNSGTFSGSNLYYDNVSGNNGITTTLADAPLHILGNSTITGPGTVTDDGSGNILGSGTSFVGFFSIGDYISIPDTGDFARIISIGDDANMVVSPATTASNNIYQYSRGLRVDDGMGNVLIKTSDIETTFYSPSSHPIRYVKANGAPIPNSDSNAIVVYDVGLGAAANVWFNLPSLSDESGPITGTFGYTVDGFYKSGMQYSVDNNYLIFTNDIANPFATSGFFIDGMGGTKSSNNNQTVGEILDSTGSGGNSGDIMTSTGSANNWKSKLSAGIPTVVANVDLTAQTAAKTTTTLFTPTTTGFYRISIYLQVTSVGSVSSILGGATGVVVTYKDGDGNVTQTDTVGLTAPNGTVVTTLNTNTTATNLSGSLEVYAHSGTAITYAIGYTSVGTAMQYAAHLSCEYIR